MQIQNQQPSASTTGGNQTVVVALVPAFNEERFIGSLVLAVSNYVDAVVVVDDGSRDRTIDIAQKAGAIVVRHDTNQGKAAAVNTGFAYLRQLRPTAVVMLDGDGQHSADDIPQVLEPILNQQADIVVGSRFSEIKSDIPAYRQFGQHSLTLATNLTSGVWISDSQSGFRAFSCRALDCLIFGQNGFSLESEMQFLVRDNDLRVMEVAISVTYDEPAKRSPVRHGMQVLHGILQLVGQTRPLLSFGIGGVGLFLCGSLLGTYIIRIYAQTHELAVGYALLTVLLCMLGVIMMFAGIILHSVRGLIMGLQHTLFEYLGRREPTMVLESQPEELMLEVGR